MGKNISIKARLLFLVSIPILAVLVLSMMFLNKTFEQKENLETTHNRVLEVESIARVIHYMQIERGMSIGYVVSGGKNNRDAIVGARDKVNSAIDEIKDVYKTTEGDASVLENISELNQKRASVDSLSMSAQETAAYFTKTILSFIDVAVVAPLFIENREIRNDIQAYTHLVSIKEQLGQMRALLNGAFIKNELTSEAYFALGGSLDCYKVNLRKFNQLASKELKSFYKEKVVGSDVERTFEIIELAVRNGTSGNFGIDASEWFRVVTATINLFNDVDEQLE